MQEISHTVYEVVACNCVFFSSNFCYGGAADWAKFVSFLERRAAFYAKGQMLSLPSLKSNESDIFGTVKRFVRF